MGWLVALACWLGGFLIGFYARPYVDAWLREHDPTLQEPEDQEQAISDPGCTGHNMWKT